jgi:superfamily I DNA/RNA helicase
MESKYICLRWHELSAEQRETTLVQLRQQLCPIAFQRLACVLKIHDGIKFVGSFRELSKLANILHSQDHQAEYLTLLMDFSERIADASASGYTYDAQSLEHEFSWLPDVNRKALGDLIRRKHEEACFIAACMRADWSAAHVICRESTVLNKDRIEVIADKVVNAFALNLIATKRFTEAANYISNSRTLISSVSYLKLEEHFYSCRLCDARESARAALSQGLYARAVESLTWAPKSEELWLRVVSGKHATEQIQEYIKSQKDIQGAELFLDQVRPYINDEVVSHLTTMLAEFRITQQKAKFQRLFEKGQIVDAFNFARDCNLPRDWSDKAVVEYGERCIETHVGRASFRAAFEFIDQLVGTVSPERISAWRHKNQSAERIHRLKIAKQLAMEGDMAGLAELSTKQPPLIAADVAIHYQNAADVSIKRLLTKNSFELAREFLLFHRDSLLAKFFVDQLEKIAAQECQHWLTSLEKGLDEASSLSEILSLLRQYPPPPAGIYENKWQQFLGLVTSLSPMASGSNLDALISALDDLVSYNLAGKGKPGISEKWITLKRRILLSARANFLETLLATPLEEKKWGEFDRRFLSINLDVTEREGWLIKKAAAIADALKSRIRLDKVQARILASPAKTIRVTARAGSGKTGILKALAFFLVDQCDYQTDEVLLLAFNRKNADELEDQLINLLKVPAFPGARTFHSLAYSIAQPEEAVLVNRGEDVQSQQLTLCIQDILRSHLDNTLLGKIYEVFRRESSIVKSMDALLSGEARYDFRRSLKNYTLGGYLVKSAGEKYIGDFLFEHGLKYFYEDSFRWDRSFYRPDFKIMTSDKTFVIWEHWAVDPDAIVFSRPADWTEKKQHAYQQSAKHKRNYWAEKNIPLIETCSSECADREQFEVKLTDLLRPHFPQLCRLPKTELLNRVAEIHLSRLAQWLAQGVQRSQKQGWDAVALADQLDNYTPASEREGLFLELLRKVFAAYEPKLEAEKKTDFDRLFNRAIDILRTDPSRALLKGQETSIDLRRLRYCLVDEAQDLSPQFIEALLCLRELNPSLRLLFVGDDWQAINRFAGSNVELFSETITTRFGKCATPNLTTNYRSARNVVETGNCLMAGQGEPATAHSKTPGTIEMAFLDQVWIESREGYAQAKIDQPFQGFRGGAGALLKAIYQLSIPDLIADRSVGVIFRTNMSYGYPITDLEKGFVRILRKMGWPQNDVAQWQKQRIRFSTAHKFKGGECDTVFVVEPHTGAFPLLNADSIELFRFFGETIAQAEGDERRLFYVAITRAKERLVFLAEKRRSEEESPYLDIIRDKISLIRVPEVPFAPEPDIRAGAEVREVRGLENDQEPEVADDSELDVQPPF